MHAGDLHINPSGLHRTFGILSHWDTVALPQHLVYCCSDRLIASSQRQILFGILVSSAEYRPAAAQHLLLTLALCELRMPSLSFCCAVVSKSEAGRTCVLVARRGP
jgi:hypothetical protein